MYNKRRTLTTPRPLRQQLKPHPLTPLPPKPQQLPLTSSPRFPLSIFRPIPLPAHIQLHLARRGQIRPRPHPRWQEGFYDRLELLEGPSEDPEGEEGSDEDYGFHERGDAVPA